METLVFPLFPCVLRGPKGASAVPGGKDSGWPQFLCAICESHSARSAHTDLPGVVSHAAAQSTGASVQHAHRPSAGHTAHGRGAHSAHPQVSHQTAVFAIENHNSLSQTLLRMFFSDPNLADNTRQGLNKILADEVPIEIKPVNPPDFYRRVAMEPKTLFWVRARGHIGKISLSSHHIFIVKTTYDVMHSEKMCKNGSFTGTTACH